MGLFDDIKKISKGGDLFNPTKDVIKTSSIPAMFNALRSDNNLEDAFKRHTGALKQSAAAGALSGLGPMVHLLKDSNGRKAPPVGDAPAIGAGVTAAKQEARRRAIAQARQRMGLASTISTTPLGIVGGGAATGERRLTGE